MKSGREIAADLLNLALDGHITVGSFCGQFEQLFNFDWADRKQDPHYREFQQLFDCVVYYSPFPEERSKYPAFKTEADVLAFAERVRAIITA